MRFIKQSGQSMTEFVIVMPVLIILILGGFQFALIYHAKITLNYATFMAARSGAVSNAHAGIMENALARGMAPLYTHCDDAKEVQRARDRVQAEIAAGFARIQIINPPQTAFLDNTSYRVTTSLGIDKVIPNDNLMYRVKTAGTASSLSIQDANLLKIRASYCYPMYVPYVDRLITTLLTTPPDPDNCPECLDAFPDSVVGNSFERGCLDNDRFPINSIAIVRMQSDISQNATNSELYPGPAAPGTAVTIANTSCP